MSDRSGSTPAPLWQQTPSAAERRAAPGRHPAVRVLDLALLAVVVVVAVVLATIHLAPAVGFRVVAVSGEVMAPALPAGAAAVVRDVPFDDLREGDAILVHTAGPATIIRRIVQVRELGTNRADVYFGVKADTAPAAEDRLVRASRVLGRVDASVPLLGHLVAAGSSQLGAWTVLSVIGSLFTLRLLVDEFAHRHRRAGDPGPAPLRRARTAR